MLLFNLNDLDKNKFNHQPWTASKFTCGLPTTVYIKQLVVCPRTGIVWCRQSLLYGKPFLCGKPFVCSKSFLYVKPFLCVNPFLCGKPFLYCKPFLHVSLSYAASPFKAVSHFYLVSPFLCGKPHKKRENAQQSGQTKFFKENITLLQKNWILTTEYVADHTFLKL